MPEIANEKELLAMLSAENEIGWQTLIYELVRSQRMDPWDIDLSALAQHYIETVKRLQELDFKLSGKVLLAAAVLLHIKSTQLLEVDLAALDALFAPPQELELGQELEPDTALFLEELPIDRMTLIPRTPQPRKRKISVFDLVAALQKALEVRHRRLLREAAIPEVVVPERKLDIARVIFELYERIKAELMVGKKLYFDELVPPSAGKADKIYTFVPLLHLDNQQKIELQQARPFDKIEISLCRQAVSEDKNAKI